MINRFPPAIQLCGYGIHLREWTNADLPTMRELFDDTEVTAPGETLPFSPRFTAEVVEVTGGAITKIQLRAPATPDRREDGDDS